MHTDVASSQAWWPGSVPFPPNNWLFFVLAVFCDYCSSANGDSGPHGDAVCAHRGRCRARAPVGQGCLCLLLGSVQGTQSCHFQPPPSLRGRAASVCGTRVQAAAIEAPESEITSAAQVVPGRGWRGTKSCRSLLVCSLTAKISSQMELVPVHLQPGTLPWPQHGAGAQGALTQGSGTGFSRCPSSVIKGNYKRDQNGTRGS